ncbi:DUF2855 family protein [Temperatibacter marinus]|uniref:DUF2855 family protein n=1 Tax=Temperatibacter marinus TaxID=1456591 RepID=A0AA52H9A9_9PROT|nr:DUF2855 family protein [Temperatibacter marinus]WND02991.1 DUF2855 family protein [Temperatibacter marinus]
MKNTELWTKKSNLRKTRTVESDLMPLQEGGIRVSVDKFALTSNNVGYAMSGEMIGYWHYFPTGEDDWGKVTVWGMADVIESNCAEISVGERLYGFFPMSRYLDMIPGRIKEGYFFDESSHRASLPALYNQYSRTQGEPEGMRALENERCILFPLFMTGFVIADFMLDHDWFNAGQIIVGSVSSKTGIGTASFIKKNGYKGQLIGLTSAGNKDFVKGLDICDQVVTYDAIKSLAQTSSVYIDMSGDAATRLALHTHLESDLQSSQIVGATHWEDASMKQEVPGVRPAFFFTPGQIDKRNKEWGPGVLMEKATVASAGLAVCLKGQLSVERHQGAEACAQIWLDMLDNKISGKRGILVSL